MRENSTRTGEITVSMPKKRASLASVSDRVFCLSNSNRNQTRAAGAGFTLLELLVVIAIIGLLLAILFPAFSSSRESARRIQCVNNLRQLGVALNNFESARRKYPAGSISQRYAAQPTTPHTFYRWSVLAQLTPFLEQTAAYNSLDLSVPLYGRNFQVFEQNQQAVARVIPEFLCPSDDYVPGGDFGPTNYAACAGSGINGGSPMDTDGAFYTNSATRPRDVRAGLSHTAAFSESVLGQEVPRRMPRAEADPRYVYAFAQATPLTEESCAESAFWNFANPRGFAWVNGEYRSALYNHFWTPNSANIDCISALTSGPISIQYAAYGWRAARSLHAGGVNLSLLDGSVRFIEDSVNLDIWQAMSKIGGL